MTTTDVKVLATRSRGIEQAIRGVHAPLIITEAPATASALLGKPLVGQTLTVDGDYVCLIPCRGLTGTLAVHIEVTLTAMTAESEGPDTLFDFDPRVTNVADAVVRTSAADDGALTTETPDSHTVALAGELYARYTLVIAGSPTSVVVDRAEYVSL